MKNLWNQSDAAACNSELDMRVYSSRLLGAAPSLVLHGGGNTSVKAEFINVFSESVPALYVKGSGWDLRTIEAAGFPPVDLAYLQRLGALAELSDTDMMRQLRLALLDPAGPTPSVEAILHAIIPCKYVDHTHADAVVTLSNTPGGTELLQDLLGDEVLILPYTMPGFVLARQVAEATLHVDWERLKGIVLLHHGIFTFHEEAEQSYSNMIELVSMAEKRLATRSVPCGPTQHLVTSGQEELALAKLRKAASQLFGAAVLVQWDKSEPACGFAALENAAELVQRGPLTPDHSIHTKPFGAVFEDNLPSDLAQFAALYRAYFDSHRLPEHRILDLMPRFGVWLGKGMIYLAANAKRLQIVRDISTHTLSAIQQAEAFGGWEALSREDLFAVEYWELEQAKLKTHHLKPEMEGMVALVTGAASGIGLATVEALAARGAAVVALDVAFSRSAGNSDLPQAAMCLQVDVTDETALQEAIHSAVRQFGGIDLLVSNAGSFPSGSLLADIDEATWQQSLDLNLSAHLRLLRCCEPYLSEGYEPAVVFVGSKNVPAPGPGAGAYSVAKSGMTQLMRIAALELGKKGIRCNAVHPNAVYDTAIWTEEVLASRAAHYGVSVEDYKSANVLGTELGSQDVAEVICALLSQRFAKTTGAQVPIDGGNERVI
jgi:rhamnose utilization protein RhaD (predicted bifunctional aldolase and dehydrogenase)/NAD(P)-dependent dehydrogenase (short-subunit alcohol dehydrogenase family)